MPVAPTALELAAQATNRAAFNHYSILQRTLHDISARRISVELFGHTLPLPVLLAPIGVLEMVHRQADLAAARTAAAEGLTFITSS